MERYDATEIEPRWVKVWAEEELYRASDDPDDPRPRFYALDMFPYPSGDLHMGHAEAFAGGDAIARFRWMQGHNVLHPIGWDSFGLNAENAAIKRGTPPAEWTYANIEQQADSFKRLGMSFDWTRRLHTSDPEFYRWTQWLFLRFFERGLAYRKQAPVNWCPKDQTVLANEQVIGGRAVVLQDHRLRPTAARRRGDPDRLARARGDHAAELDRSLAGRRGHVRGGGER
jgi:leucyl-tRNA synthetase